MKKVLLVFLLLALSLSYSSVAAYSQGSLMADMLTAYSKGDFEEATRLAKKQNRHYRYAGAAKMSAAMKKSYQKVLKQKDISAYYLADLNQDGQVELVYIKGDIEAAMRLYVAGYSKGKLLSYGPLAAGHSAYYAYPDHAGLVCLSAQMGYEEISVIRIKNGKLEKKILNHRENVKSYLPLGEALNHHVRKNGQLNRNL